MLRIKRFLCNDSEIMNEVNVKSGYEHLMRSSRTKWNKMFSRERSDRGE